MKRRAFLRGAAFAGGAALAAPAWTRALVTPGAAGLSLATDPRRPQFHFLPAANWMNDPNGPIYWKGKYHMFYQYNPNGAFWGDMHWGHATSRDMIHWQHRPVALAPTPGGPDADGVFTGTAVVDGERVGMLYTGVVARGDGHGYIETQCLAWSTDDNLEAWTKEPKAVLSAPPEGLETSGFRDPAPWRQGDSWFMALGSGIRGGSGMVLLYRSPDLRKWEYLHPLAEGAHNGNPVYDGDMWECPDFFALGNKHVLIHSWNGKAYWQVGEFDAQALLFHPQQTGVLDSGSFYAPKTQLDAQQNRILWGWIPEMRPVEEHRAAGWAGVMSLPRVLTLDEKANLCVAPLPALEKLRRKPRTVALSANEKQNQRQLEALRITDCCAEILVNAKASSGAWGLLLIPEGLPDAKPWLWVRYNPARPAEIEINETSLPLVGTSSAPLELRIFLDGSVIEAFVNNRAAHTARFYYPGASAPPVRIHVEGSSALSRLTAWQISPISADRLTSAGPGQ